MTSISPRRDNDQEGEDWKSSRQSNNKSPGWTWGIGLCLTISGMIFAWVVQPLSTKIDNLGSRMAIVETKTDTAKEWRLEQLEATRDLVKEVINLKMEVKDLRSELKQQRGIR